ncbi:anti-sigma B factor antagonist [Nocardia pseudobrasiliensis]|uniref:Anti-sigma B factor antagonist n=1 Tax=Nocardia pseudobrasiliensis TaxID=45979 RepID=A0A370HZH6_9NOCA|nr:anti-sigma B factor antagonist [Nocardia pseudobrasiliensis]
MDCLLTAAVTRAANAVVVTLAGELDLVSAPRLRTALDEALADPAAVLVVDLTAVTFFGLIGSALLLDTVHARAPRPVRILAPPRVRRPLEAVGLDHLLTLSPDLVSAISTAG